MKQLSFEDVMKLTEGSDKLYDWNLAARFNSFEDIKSCLFTPFSPRSKKELLGYYLVRSKDFIIIPNIDSLKNLKILKGSCAEDTLIREFKIGKKYDLKVGDPFKISNAKCLGQIKGPFANKFLAFKEEKNFYFFWINETLSKERLEIVEIIK